jgi:hypothetical protein
LHFCGRVHALRQRIGQRLGLEIVPEARHVAGMGALAALVLDHRTGWGKIGHLGPPAGEDAVGTCDVYGYFCNQQGRRRQKTMSDDPGIRAERLHALPAERRRRGAVAPVFRVYKDRYGMLRTEWRVLFHLGRYGAMSAREISRRAGIHKTKVSRAVAALERKRFLERREARRIGGSRSSICARRDGRLSRPVAGSGGA